MEPMVYTDKYGDVPQKVYTTLKRYNVSTSDYEMLDDVLDEMFYFNSDEARFDALTMVVTHYVKDGMYQEPCALTKNAIFDAITGVETNRVTRHI